MGLVGWLVGWLLMLVIGGGYWCWLLVLVRHVPDLPGMGAERGVPGLTQAEMGAKSRWWALWGCRAGAGGIDRGMKTTSQSVGGRDLPFGAAFDPIIQRGRTGANAARGSITLSPTSKLFNI